MCDQTSPASRAKLNDPKKAVRSEPESYVQRGKEDSADWVIEAPQDRREYLGHPLRRLLIILADRPHSPHSSEGWLQCRISPQSKSESKFTKMRIRDVLLGLFDQLQEPKEDQTTDATGLNRVADSQCFVNRTNYRVMSVETTASVDCSISLILYIHCSMIRLQNGRIA